MSLTDMHASSLVDIDAAADRLIERGAVLLPFDGVEADGKGIAMGPGPDIAWFDDPAGNILAILQEK